MLFLQKRYSLFEDKQKRRHRFPCRVLQRVFLRSGHEPKREKQGGRRSRGRTLTTLPERFKVSPAPDGDFFSPSCSPVWIGLVGGRGLSLSIIGIFPFFGREAPLPRHPVEALCLPLSPFGLGQNAGPRFPLLVPLFLRGPLAREKRLFSSRGIGFDLWQERASHPPRLAFPPPPLLDFPIRHAP